MKVLIISDRCREGKYILIFKNGENSWSVIKIKSPIILRAFKDIPNDSMAFFNGVEISKN